VIAGLRVLAVCVVKLQNLAFEVVERCVRLRAQTHSAGAAVRRCSAALSGGQQLFGVRRLLIRRACVHMSKK
jgi:hypothetical protein